MPSATLDLRLRFLASVSSCLVVAAATTWSPDAGAQAAPSSPRAPESVWGDVEAGVDHVALSRSFAYPTPATGPMLGLGAGARFGAWTLGLRGRITPASDITLYQGALEVGLHPVRSGPWDPYVSVHGGYAVVSVHATVSIPAFDSPQAYPITLPNLRGPEAGLSFGGDYRLSPLFSLGLDVTADALFLSAPADYLPEGAGNVGFLVRDPVSGLGFDVGGAVYGRLHFEL